MILLKLPFDVYDRVIRETIFMGDLPHDVWGLIDETPRRRCASVDAAFWQFRGWACKAALVSPP